MLWPQCHIRLVSKVLWLRGSYMHHCPFVNTIGPCIRQQRRLLITESICKWQMLPKMWLGMWREKNVVGKGEKVGYQHFLLFLQCFQRFYFRTARIQDILVKGCMLLVKSFCECTIILVSLCCPGQLQMLHRLISVNSARFVISST